MTTKPTQHEVRDPEIERLLRRIARRMDYQLPPGWGFALFLMSYEDAGSNVFYISSAEREGVIDAVRTWLAKQETSH